MVTVHVVQQLVPVIWAIQVVPLDPSYHYFQAHLNCSLLLDFITSPYRTRHNKLMQWICHTRPRLKPGEADESGIFHTSRLPCPYPLIQLRCAPQRPLALFLFFTRRSFVPQENVARGALVKNLEFGIKLLLSLYPNHYRNNSINNEACL